MSLREIVRVRAQIEAAAPTPRPFGAGLLLLTGSNAAPTESLAVGITLQGTSGAPSGEATSVASRWFGQSPFPNELRVRGYFPGGATAGKAWGTAPTYADGDAILNETVTIDGVTTTFVAADNTLAKIATKLATNAKISTCVVAGGRLVITFVATANSALGFSGSAVAKLGLENAVIFQALAAAETVTSGLDRINDEDSNWVLLLADSSLNDADEQLAADWAAANDKFFIRDTTSLGVPNLRSKKQTGVIYSATQDNKAASLAARMSGMNLEAAGALANLNYRQLVGCVTDRLTPDQRTDLVSKNVSFYQTIGGRDVIRGGRAMNGDWLDSQYWILWLVRSCETALFDLLVRSNRTTVAAIQSEVEGVLSRGVFNGGIAPGIVTDDLANRIRLATGNDSFDGFLSNGYLVYVPPTASQSQADRTARLSPTVNVWCKGSETINEIDLSITFQL